MCCTISGSATRRFLTKHKDKIWVDAYKLLRADGRPGIVTLKEPYKPGLYIVKQKIYFTHSPRGFHFYLSKRAAERKIYSDWWSTRVLLKVKIHKNSIFGIGKNGEFTEGVARKMRITVADWKAAGFQLPKKSSKKGKQHVKKKGK